MRPFTLTCLDTPDTDRGVGLALVLETPTGKTWLYDTGCGYPDGQGGWEGEFNAGRDLVAPFMAERGIRKLDGVIVSHAHYDHFGGLLWLVDNLDIGTIIDTGYNFSGKSDASYSRELADYVELRERFRQRGGGYRAAVAGDILPIDPELEVKVLAPPKGFFPDLHPEKRNPQDPASHYMLNANAIVLGIRHGKIRFVLGGDIEKEDQEEALVPSLPAGALRCDVLVAPGHGLHTAPAFVEAAKPSLVVVSLFERWLESCTARSAFEAAGAQVLVTGRDGRIVVTSDGERYATRTAKTEGS
jgi:competence protein ComEC